MTTRADPPRVFELRTYHAAPGKLAALERRFREHTLGLFARHGMEVVGFWRSLDGNGEPSGDLVYVLAFASRGAADSAWEAFRVDPAWVKAKEASEVDGALTAEVESLFMEATDYSPLS